MTGIKVESADVVLVEIHIENFAIIDTLHVQFSEGLNIVTGETGAGKSILVDALTVALGGRAYTEFIRAGTEKAVVEAVFDLRHVSEARTKACEYGFLDDTQDETELLIRREITRSGRNRLLVNGHPATNAMVADLGDLLVDIHGQHEHQSILNPDYHGDLLDLYGKVLPLRDQVTAKFRQFKKCDRELRDLQAHSRERLQHLDLLRFQHQEIAKARLRPGEDEELLQERKVLASAEQLTSETGIVYEILYGQSGAILERLGEITRRLEELTNIDPSLTPYVKVCESAQYQLEDVAFSLRDYTQAIEFDPYRLEEIEKRLDELNSLKRKYGSSIEEILALHENIQQELDHFDARETHITDLEAEYAALRDQLQHLSQKLSHERRQVADAFETQLMVELAALGMEKTQFRVDFRPAGIEKQPFTAKGSDKIEFLITPNPGEPLKPLNRIASGGEISRIMLALKTLLGAVDRIPVMIFDEIDTGIGGKIAEIVGKKLQHISTAHQVICITHLPQIASKAATHFHVAKQTSQDRTVTAIRVLSSQERLEELAHMLGGETITPTTRQHAREMLEKNTTHARPTSTKTNVSTAGKGN
ncbi:DNA repair protein RecN [candidate division KSB3 bacterium]|uniref:DNA repair protein RecN n=1 Tax=candidate division KSB3 bacterium TaxID=2044937 RepID=A0A9D5K0J9_9BACT|nr:DNA repair protein RecN [candidate division KSB3 bacterium]MBD3327653.1 DNA repair protein RecN [candidate division KSB3 bacterium]